MTELGRDVPGPPASEERFTAPTPLCPRPNFWTSTDGDSTEVEVSDLAYGLVRALQPTLCLETGSGFGQTTARIGEALRANGHGGLYALDFDPERAEATRTACRDLPVTVVATDSLKWVPPADARIDFAWLDSWYEHRIPELHRFLPWTRSGTIICFHDTAPGHGSHRIESGHDLRTEIELYGARLRYVHLPTPRGVTITEVRW